jgi:hypothetical protein
VVTINLNPRVSLSLVMDGMSGSFSAAARTVSVILMVRFIGFVGIFSSDGWGWQARSVQAAYKRLDANVNHDVSMIRHDAPRCTVRRGYKAVENQRLIGGAQR